MRRCSFFRMHFFFFSCSRWFPFCMYIVLLWCVIVGVPSYTTDVSRGNMFSYFLPSNISRCVSLLSNVMVLSRQDNDNAVFFFLIEIDRDTYREMLVLLLLWRIGSKGTNKGRKTDESSYLILIFQNKQTVVHIYKNSLFFLDSRLINWSIYIYIYTVSNW